jgi:sporulation protein YlmC with PRC-barrel domain
MEVQGKANMKTILFDSLDEAYAQKLTGCTVIDESGETVGTVDGLWIDSTSHRVEFVGVKSSSFSNKVHVMPAREAQIVEEGNLIRLRYPAALMEKAPSYSSGAAPVQVEREKMNCDSNTEPPRISSIDEMRSEEGTGRPSPDQDAEACRRFEESTDRRDLESGEQAFFNQKGFVTDSMSEVNASEELLRVQNEAKIRNREDRIKSGSLD